MLDNNSADTYANDYYHPAFIPYTDLDQVDTIIQKSTIAQNTLNYIHSNWAVLVIIGVVNFLSVAIIIQNY